MNGRKVREARLSMGVAAKALAQSAGIAERTLVEIEEGKRQATEETLFGLARALGLDAAKLLADAPAASPVPAPAGGDADAKETE